MPGLIGLKRLGRFKPDAAAEIFRLMILKVWVNEFLDGNFELV